MRHVKAPSCLRIDRGQAFGDSTGQEDDIGQSHASLQDLTPLFSFDRLGLFGVRFQDDLLVLAPTRWKRRTAVMGVNQVVASLGLAKHPGKTFIGRIEKGFDWLGYPDSPAGLTLAMKTLKNVGVRLRQLDEQEPSAAAAAYRLGVYVRRWVRWGESRAQPYNSKPDPNFPLADPSFLGKYQSDPDFPKVLPGHGAWLRDRNRAANMHDARPAPDPLRKPNAGLQDLTLLFHSFRNATHMDNEWYKVKL